MQKKWTFGLILLAGGLWFSSTIAGAALSTKREMPDFLGDRTWYNTKPLSKEELLGKVTLVNFWSYAHAPSLRNADYLNKWQDTYGVYGLNIIAFHSPDFPFEEKFENFKEVFPNLGHFYPGALDSDRRVWRAFNVLEKPANFFIDARGRIRGIFYGEKDYAKQEALLQKLLLETRGGLDQEIMAPEPVVDFTRSLTRDILMGSRQNAYYGNAEIFKFQQPTQFNEPEFIQPGKYYLTGKWELHERFIRVIQTPSSLIVKFKSNGAHMIASTRYDIPVDIEVMLDGYPISPADVGIDVDAKFGKSFLVLEEPKLYQIVDTRDDYSEKTLQLNFQQPGAEIYGLSFGRIIPFKIRKEQTEAGNDAVSVQYEYLEDDSRGKKDASATLALL